MKPRLVHIALMALTLLVSCTATKHVGEDEYLLNNYKIEAGDGEFEGQALNDYIKQKPNKRVLYWKFYLSMYNLSNPEKDSSGFHNWLRRIGEAPVIYNENLTDRSTEQLELYMNNRGFYHAEVSDTTIFKKKKARVIYRVDPGEPYRINDISYFFEDAGISDIILADTGSSKFKKGELFDMEVLKLETERIEALLQDSGYYKFTRDFVYFEADSALKSKEVDITLGVRNYPDQDRLGNPIHTGHPVYKIRDVYLTTSFRPSTRYLQSGTAQAVYDTIMREGVHVLFRDKPNIRPGMVAQKNFIIPGDLYSLSLRNQTNRNLSQLSASRMVDINYREVDERNKLLDCDILITPATLQSYTVKLEGTNSEGNIGAAANVSYQHRNLFGGSELFELSFFGAIESLQGYDDPDSTQENSINLLQEYGVEAKLSIPKFLLPFRSDQFIRKYNPETVIRLSYNYQRQPKYVRTMVSASLGYNWRGTERMLHRVYPAEISLIQTPYKSDEFNDWLEGKYLYWSYQPHMILDSRYSLIWSNKKLLKNTNFQDIRWNFETAGNLLYGGYRLLVPPPDSGNYQLFNVDFAQYIKTDIDIRNYYILNEGISLVLRGFAGIGYAYGNSQAMPFEKQYFSGGANSIRAWQVKSLGPGSYEDLDETEYPNQTGDVKLEANMEYRFTLFWKLEAALFLDVGNIWSLNREDDRDGAGFEFNSFYKELAVGTGFGTRAVFSFFVFRFDLGVPLRSPYAIEGSNWLPGNSGISGRDLTFNIAIGYPF